MTEYIISLPYVDEHEQNEDFVNEILKLSNLANDDGRPVFSTPIFAEAMAVVNKTCEICQRYFQTIEFKIGIEVCGKGNDKWC